LILNNSEKIDEIIEDIEKINDKRKELTKIFCDNAMQNINPKDNVIFYVSKEIEHGII
jgi:single-stranded DNA-specific DHH superfamily exonuclease